MKRAQIVGISIAAVAGLGAFYVASTFVRPPPAPLAKKIKVDAVQVLVARSSLGLGDIADESSFRWQDWPKSAVSPNFITRSNRPAAPQDLSGSIARSALNAGEPITGTKLIKAGSGGVLAAILSPGMRAISIRISEHTSVGRLILPNDHVDVYLTTRDRPKSGDQDEIATELLLGNVRVLAIGQLIEVKEGRKIAEGNVASLELTPRQAQLLTEASVKGEITLALRSIADVGGKRGKSGHKVDETHSVRVLRYGVKSKAYGVN